MFFPVTLDLPYNPYIPMKHRSTNQLQLVYNMV